MDHPTGLGHVRLSVVTNEAVHSTEGEREGGSRFGFNGRSAFMAPRCFVKCRSTIGWTTPSLSSGQPAENPLINAQF